MPIIQPGSSCWEDTPSVASSFDTASGKYSWNIKSDPSACNLIEVHASGLFVPSWYNKETRYEVAGGTAATQSNLPGPVGSSVPLLTAALSMTVPASFLCSAMPWITSSAEFELGHSWAQVNAGSQFEIRVAGSLTVSGGGAVVQEGTASPRVVRFNAAQQTPSYDVFEDEPATMSFLPSCVLATPIGAARTFTYTVNVTGHRITGAPDANDLLTIAGLSTLRMRVQSSMF